MSEIFLETAELRVKERKDIHLNFWSDNVDRILQLNDKNILQNAGSISNAQMEEKVRGIYDQFDQKRKQIEAKIADLEDLRSLEEQIKKSKK
jgi:hypothetical protein